eukprot:scaffold282690_cov22-Prasinocladus_malaysianus.AAC.1
MITVPGFIIAHTQSCASWECLLPIIWLRKNLSCEHRVDCYVVAVTSLACAKSNDPHDNPLNCFFLPWIGFQNIPTYATSLCNERRGVCKRPKRDA